MAEMRGADEDGVDLPTVNHLIYVREGSLTLHQWWDGAVAFTQTSHGHAWNFTCTNVGEVRFAHVAKADDTESDCVHILKKS
jgi:hypothetical protein